MQNTLFPPLLQNDASGSAEPPKQQRLLSSVRQDKRALFSARTASPQPAPDTKSVRAQAVPQKRVRSHSHLTTHEKAVKVTLWVEPGVKAEVQRIAQLEGLSVSATGGALLQQALQQYIDLQYGPLLRPVIQDEIKKRLQGYTRFLVRVAFDVGQIRSLVTNILGKLPGVTDDMVNEILDGSSKSARSNMFRRTPQIAAILEAVEQLLQEEERHTSKGHGICEEQIHKKQQES
jgi:hypothetical protein